MAFAQAHEVPWPRDPVAQPHGWGIHEADPPPFNRLRGPVHARGGVAGVAWLNGHEVAAWGDPERADLTFSVAKSYLAMLAGVAHRQGLLPDVDEPVAARLHDIGFESDHNRTITWRHLLQQTSEWEGACFGVPDTVDRYRTVSHDPRPPVGRKGEARPLRTPGSYWEYNDVRINQLALALLHLFRRPLPQVFSETLLAPAGGTSAFAWRGYDDAWVEIDGHPVQSVPGGTHWGGGVSIGARDQARLAQLVLDDGRLPAGPAAWAAGWSTFLREPCKVAPFYGALVWLNPGGRTFPAASPESIFMIGAGGHYVWIEPTRRAVVVVRWLDSAAAGRFIELAAAALSVR
ncbi:MAG: serine hydrolase [Rubrivivax sp.]|nr:serine hydrolase [Rubrivivax sp.]